VGALFYWVPANIIVGAGASLVAVAPICLLGEVGITTPGPFGTDVLVGCQGESVVAPRPANYVVAETLPVSNPDPMVEITAVNGVSVPSGPGGLLLLDPALGQLQSPPEDIAVEGSFDNLSPTGVTVDGVAASLAGNTFSVTLPGFLGAEDEARGLFVEARDDSGPQPIAAADSLVVRTKRQTPRMQFVIFESEGGNEALSQAGVGAARRQAALELLHLCTAPNATPSATLPGLESRLQLVATDTTVRNQTAYDLLLSVLDLGDPILSPEAEILLAGRLPDTNDDPNNEIPDPGAFGCSAGPLGCASPLDFRVFVSGRFRREVMTPLGVTVVELPQHSEQGLSQFGEALFSEPASQAIFLQTRLGDSETGALGTDRPVLSSLAHEFVHIIAGIQDNAEEEGEAQGLPMALPLGPDFSSLMNSFPFFRSLVLGSASSAECPPFAPKVSSLDEICQRILVGYECPASAGERLDYTE
jgi:hypothetical protein